MPGGDSDTPRENLTNQEVFLIKLLERSGGRVDVVIDFESIANELGVTLRSCYSFAHFWSQQGAIYYRGGNWAMITALGVVDASEMLQRAEPEKPAVPRHGRLAKYGIAFAKYILAPVVSGLLIYLLGAN